MPGETAVTEAVARSLHKLMAYKDEYEVARLALDPAFEAQLTGTFGPGSKVSYRLHPPVLRSLGLQHKVALGPWFKPAFQVLRSSRRLRGTPADVFGYSRMPPAGAAADRRLPGQRGTSARPAEPGQPRGGDADRRSARRDPGL